MTSSESIEIEELIAIAAQQKTPESNRRLFLALRDVELFFPRTVVETEGKQVNATPLLRLPDATNAMMLYTSRDHPDLPDTFAGGKFEDALSAALLMPDLDWVIVSNSSSQWVALNRQQISATLDDLYHGGNNKDHSSPNRDGRVQALEELITRAADTPPEELSPPIGSLLRGREIFVELADIQGGGGQPIMKTFTVSHLARLVRAYTTRTRPGITYGGIQWEALKNMIRTSPELDGVQIINQADDWVVFDRESLRGAGTTES